MNQSCNHRYRSARKSAQPDQNIIVIVEYLDQFTRRSGRVANALHPKALLDVEAVSWYDVDAALIHSHSCCCFGRYETHAISKAGHRMVRGGGIVVSTRAPPPCTTDMQHTTLAKRQVLPTEHAGAIDQ
jgi:hypothetical protein